MFKSNLAVFFWYHFWSCFFPQPCRFSSQSSNCVRNKIHHYSCTGVPSWYQTNSVIQDTITHLEIQRLELDVLDVESLIYNFTHITNLTIVNGNISSLEGSFHPENNISVLLLKNLLVETITNEFFENLYSLVVLDLRGNRLTGLDFQIVRILNRIPEVFLSGNRWNCMSDLKWLLDLNTTVVHDMNEMKCYQHPYPGKPLRAIAEFKENIRSSCPNQCECILPDVVRDPSTQILEPIIEVNCSNRNLTDFPPRLPAKTKILLLEKNNISRLQSLLTIPVYKDVLDVYLDHNMIESIDDLEGTYWLTHFRVVSLTYNKLSQLPTYAIDDALEQNPNMPVAVAIFLGNNPWKCDCSFIPGFQEMLRKYETQVKDASNIKCSFVEGDDNSFVPILELTRSSICHLPVDYSIQALDFVNGTLATLLAFLLGKLLYDYYYFKKTGRLPWIVTKIP